MQSLLAHAELTRTKSSTETADARRAPRRQRCGNLTLLPVVFRADQIFATNVPADLRIVASISNISRTGVGLIAAEPLPEGLEFDVDWTVDRDGHGRDRYGRDDHGSGARPLRFEVVHSRPAGAGMYRVGARLIAGELPDEPNPDIYSGTRQADADMDPSVADAPVFIDTQPGNDHDGQTHEEPTNSDPFTDEPYPIRGGIMKFAPEPRQSSADTNTPVPPGTFRASAAFGFDKTEKLEGRTTCGWERSVELRRDGDKMWVYIHSPGKKNGWGIYVNATQFESAVGRIQSAAKSPFATSMAA